MSRRRRRSGKKKDESASRPQVDAFWGAADQEPAPVARIRPTPEPAALPRSLGDPPLTPDTAAAHHVAVVYEEAVRAATALAAANGLLEADPTAED